MQRQTTLAAQSIALVILCACNTPDRRIDANYEALKDNRAQMYSLHEAFEASASEIPAWVSSYLDTWDCGDNLCAVGRAEINADDASALTCLEVSRLKAKANLVSVIQTDISGKIISGTDGLKLSQQQLKQIVVEGFEVRNLSNMRITENFHQKIVKHAGALPQAFYQCFSTASISKGSLQSLIARESQRVLDRDAATQFKQQLDQEWNRFFKINTELEPGKLRFEDLEARASIQSSLTAGGLQTIRDNLLRVAKAFLKLPYQLGGDLADGSIDCSNYVKTVYSVFGLKLPRTSPEQFEDSRGIAVDGDLVAGDLVFFHGSLRPIDQPSHVGIYIGQGKFINANGNASVRQVQIDDLTAYYWQAKYLGARRFVTDENFAAVLTAAGRP